MERQSNKRSLFCKMTSLALALLMMVSVIGIRPETVSAADKTLKAKGGTVAITDDELIATNGGPIWVKYKPSADGYLKVKFSAKSSLASYPDGMVQLYDGKKSKALSSAAYFFTDDNRDVFCSDFYGVKKNKTYYIGVMANGGVSMKASFTKAKDKSGTKESKAYTMKRKKTYTGVITAGTTNAHWYKFKLSKPSKLKINIKPNLTGDISVFLKGPGAGNSTSGTIRCRSYNSYTGTISANAWGRNYTLYNSSRKHKAGTYKIKIKPTTKTCTGSFTLKWQ